jgi:hypothetical protein
MKEYQVLDIKAYIVHARSEEEALEKFNNYDYVQEGDSWPDIKELGEVSEEDMYAKIYY